MVAESAEAVDFAAAAAAAAESIAVVGVVAADIIRLVVVDVEDATFVVAVGR